MPTSRLGFRTKYGGPEDMTILAEEHTCNCGACIEIPILFLENKAVSDLREHHTCNCGACIANINAIVDSNAIENLREDHTCDCDACTDNQGKMARNTH